MRPQMYIHRMLHFTFLDPARSVDIYPLTRNSEMGLPGAWGNLYECYVHRYVQHRSGGSLERVFGMDWLDR